MHRGLFTLLTTVALSLACGGPGAWTPPTAADTKDDPAKLRPGYGTELHTWFPLTPPELDAMKNVDAAKAGDAHALLALAIAASGNKRDAASYAAYQKRIDDVVAELRPTIDKADDYHKGYELNRALHRIFFTGAKRGKLGSYELNQNRLTGILDTGTYNCISSALLYVVLARSFGLPVRGVVVPTHAFVEYGPPGGKILEVETTSETGFDWVHDARYFKEGANDWSADRGLRPVTLEDYQARQILDPLPFVGVAFADEANRALKEDGPRRDEAGRLYELAGMLAPDDADIAENRAYVLADEADALRKRKAFRTLAKMSDVAGPEVDAIFDKWAKNEKIATLALWARYDFAEALQTTGRSDDAVALADAQLDRLDPAWKDAVKLREAFIGVLGNVMTAHVEKGEFAAGLAAISKRMDVCLADASFCRANLSVLFGNWSIAAQNEGDWQAARTHLQDCLKTIPGDKKCQDALTDLESRHQF
jgi:hypothetical protein